MTNREHQELTNQARAWMNVAPVSPLYTLALRESHAREAVEAKKIARMTRERATQKVLEQAAGL